LIPAHKEKEKCETELALISDKLSNLARISTRAGGAHRLGM
jgi:hypothetical protein